MMLKRSRSKRALAVIVAAAVAGIVAGTVAVYVRGGGSGNLADQTVNCDPALAVAKSLAPLATGEVAAFRPVDQADGIADLSFQGPDGSSTTLAAFAGRTVLLNLWATWCVPCRSEMPALDRLQASLGSDNFTVLAVNVDTRNPERAVDFLNEIGVKSLKLYTDPGLATFTALKRRGLVIGLPTTILVDPKGCRLGIMEGPAAWDSADARALVTAAIKPS